MALVKGACAFFELEFKIILPYSCLWRLSRNRSTIDATTLTLPERSRKDLQKTSLRKRKNSKIYSRQFPIQNATRIFLKTQSGIVCYKFSNSSVFVETFFVDLFEIFPSM